MEDGEFDNLPGRGKPIDLSEWQRTPETLRMSYSVMKSAGIAPAEVEIKRSITELKDQIRNCTDAEERIRLINQLNAAMVDFSVRMARLKRR